MAITGTGTQSDPWIVHNYDEIKTVISANEYVGDSNLHYLKLANDINCNDYGESFEWETVSVNWGNRLFDFDFDGHTIKNVKVKSDHRMFRSNAQCKFHNGKLLNVFLNDSYGVFCPYESGMSGILENLSISVNATGMKEAVFINCSLIQNCAIYVEQDNNAGKYIFRAPNEAVIRNSDIKIKLSVSNTEACVFYNNSQITYTIDSIRLTGVIMPTGTPEAGYYLTMRNEIHNSVIDVDFSAFDGATGNVPPIHGPSASSAWNIDTVPSNMQGQTAIKCTTNEIRNGNSLRSKGFIVVNVEE